MAFRIISKISKTEIIAAGQSVRESRRLRKFYGGSRWRKLKGVASIQLLRLAELHWYEAHGIGKKEIKIKRLLD